MATPRLRSGGNSEAVATLKLQLRREVQDFRRVEEEAQAARERRWRPALASGNTSSRLAADPERWVGDTGLKAAKATPRGSSPLAGSTASSTPAARARSVSSPADYLDCERKQELAGAWHKVFQLEESLEEAFSLDAGQSLSRLGSFELAQRPASLAGIRPRPSPRSCQMNLAAEAADRRREVAKEACLHLASWRCCDSPRASDEPPRNREALRTDMSREVAELHAANLACTRTCEDQSRQISDLRAQNQASEELWSSQRALHAAETDALHREHEEALVETAKASKERVAVLTQELQSLRDSHASEWSFERFSYDVDRAQQLTELHALQSQVEQVEGVCNKQADELDQLTSAMKAMVPKQELFRMKDNCSQQGAELEQLRAACSTMVPKHEMKEAEEMCVRHRSELDRLKAHSKEELNRLQERCTKQAAEFDHLQATTVSKEEMKRLQDKCTNQAAELERFHATTAPSVELKLSQDKVRRQEQDLAQMREEVAQLRKERKEQELVHLRDELQRKDLPDSKELQVKIISQAEELAKLRNRERLLTTEGVQMKDSFAQQTAEVERLKAKCNSMVPKRELSLAEDTCAKYLVELEQLKSRSSTMVAKEELQRLEHRCAQNAADVDHLRANTVPAADFKSLQETAAHQADELSKVREELISERDWKTVSEHIESNRQAEEVEQAARQAEELDQLRARNRLLEPECAQLRLELRSTQDRCACMAAELEQIRVVKTVEVSAIAGSSKLQRAEILCSSQAQEIEHLRAQVAEYKQMRTESSDPITRDEVQQLREMSIKQEDRIRELEEENTLYRSRVKVAPKYGLNDSRRQVPVHVEEVDQASVHVETAVQRRYVWNGIGTPAQGPSRDVKVIGRFVHHYQPVTHSQYTTRRRSLRSRRASRSQSTDRRRDSSPSTASVRGASSSYCVSRAASCESFFRRSEPEARFSQGLQAKSPEQLCDHRNLYLERRKHVQSHEQSMERFVRVPVEVVAGASQDTHSGGFGLDDSVISLSKASSSHASPKTSVALPAAVRLSGTVTGSPMERKRCLSMECRSPVGPIRASHAVTSPEGNRSLSQSLIHTCTSPAATCRSSAAGSPSDGHVVKHHSPPRERFGLFVGERVYWTGSGIDHLQHRGVSGTIVSFTEEDRVQVQFSNGSWSLDPIELSKMLPNECAISTGSPQPCRQFSTSYGGSGAISSPHPGHPLSPHGTQSPLLGMSVVRQLPGSGCASPEAPVRVSPHQSVTAQASPHQAVSVQAACQPHRAL